MLKGAGRCYQQVRPTAENLLSSVMQQHKAIAGAVLVEMLQKSASEASSATSGVSEQASCGETFDLGSFISALLFGGVFRKSFRLQDSTALFVAQNKGS